MLLNGLMAFNVGAAFNTASNSKARFSSKPENLHFPVVANCRVALLAHDSIIYDHHSMIIVQCQAYKPVTCTAVRSAGRCRASPPARHSRCKAASARVRRCRESPPTIDSIADGALWD